MCEKIGELVDAENALPKNLIIPSRTRNEFLITDTEAIRAILLKLNISSQELEDYLRERDIYLVVRQEE